MGLAWVLSGWNLTGEEFRFTQAGALAVPDGGGLGAFLQQTVADLPGPISAVRVVLDIEGGWNGDLYAFLSFGDGLAVLLNRPGRESGNLAGYGDRGFRVLLEDAATGGDIHRYRAGEVVPSMFGEDGALLGVWAPDGRETDPDLTLGTDARTALLSRFSGVDPNGVWTLFVADLEPGGVHVLRGWELRIEVETEPVNRPPVAVADSITRLRGAGVKVRPEVILGNDEDPDGDVFQLISVDEVSAGGAQVRFQEGWVIYEPGAGGAVIDSFGYVIRDSGGLEARGTVVVTVVSPEGVPARNIASLEVLSSGDLRLNGHGIPGRTYQIEAAEDLQGAPWEFLASGTADALGLWRVEFSGGGDGQTRFFRVRE